MPYYARRLGVDINGASVKERRLRGQPFPPTSASAEKLRVKPTGILLTDAEFSSRCQGQKQRVPVATAKDRFGSTPPGMTPLARGGREGMFLKSGKVLLPLYDEYSENELNEAMESEGT